MRLSSPKVLTWWIALALAALGLIGFLAPTVPFLGVASFWLVLVSAALMLLATQTKGL